MTGQSEHDDYDNPWKAAIQRFIEPFMAFLFPPIHADVDWTRPVEFLDQELQRLTRDAEVAKGIVDRLVKVCRISGEETWLLIHIEVQVQHDLRLPLRIFIYHYRIFDWHGQRAASLAVLADEQPAWRPSCYEHELWGCELRLSFPAVKLLDFAERWEELEASDNPFAVVVMAHQYRRSPGLSGGSRRAFGRGQGARAKSYFWYFEPERRRPRPKEQARNAQRR